MAPLYPYIFTHVRVVSLSSSDLDTAHVNLNSSHQAWSGVRLWLWPLVVNGGFFDDHFAGKAMLMYPDQNVPLPPPSMRCSAIGGNRQSSVIAGIMRVE